jgi:3-methyladenine DNA glycosylase AlkC
MLGANPLLEPFKNFLNPALVRAASRRLHDMWPAFDARRFELMALAGFDDLEMKARAMRIADALEATLPCGDEAAFTQACDVIESALGPPVPVDGVTGEPRDIAQGPSTSLRTGLAGWIVWPLGEFAARQGIEHPRRALDALHALTQRLTAEFAIRPFIVRHPDLVFDTLLRWTRDDSAHVRRLCSEGSRPRLPWGLRLKALIDDPSPALPILAALQDDSSEYVRRSVANHLNDIAKDHPDLVVRWVRTHLDNATAPRHALLRHASRTLVKQGHADMLALWGAGTAFDGKVTLRLSPPTLAIGGSVELALRLASSSRDAQRLVIDLVVHYVKANGTTSPKVFKGWTIELAPGEKRDLRKALPMRDVSIRRHFAGKHRVAVQINGAVLAQRGFVLGP